MMFRRTFVVGALGSSLLALAACQTSPPPPMVVPAAFTTLGVNAPYLSGPIIGGAKARAAKMRGAKIRPLTQTAAYSYMLDLDSELRRQTAGIGLDVVRVGGGIVIRVPAALTFQPGSVAVTPQFDATLLEIARTVKARNQTYVDVLAHTDLSGSPAANQTVSEKRAAVVATYLAGHGVSRARMASKGLGETAPLYNPEMDETQKAANRRVEIRLMPFTG